MYSCALRGGTADCRLKQPAVFASLRSVQGAGLPCRLGRRFKAFHAMRLHRRPAPPCASYAAYPAYPLNRYTRLRGYIGSAGLKTKTDTLTAHREHPGGRSFFHPFSVREGNTFYMARRRQEQTHTQCRDRDIDWRGTSHFLPWMVK